jgi:hypothetical protein
MKVIESHRTPDGAFRFVVLEAPDGDISLGFEGYPAHAHGDILASLSGLPIQAAIRRYVDALVNGTAIIAVARVGGRIRDVWVTDEPAPSKYEPDDETIEFRYWDGRAAA